MVICSHFSDSLLNLTLFLPVNTAHPADPSFVCFSIHHLDTDVSTYSSVLSIHGCPQDFFSMGEQIRGSGDESPPAESRGGAPVGIWGRSPQKPTKICENNA